MKQFNFQFRTTINFIVLLVIFQFCYVSCKEKLPVYNPSDINPELVDKSLQNTNTDHTVADFELINQEGVKITQEDYKNKIYVVDFFFTTCPSICPVMTNNMAKIQKEYIKVDKLKLLSLSVTPEIDNVSVLKNYAQKERVITKKWNVTTGDKKQIYELARKSYFAVVTQGDGGLQDFIHTPNFILVDTKRQIRGIYDGTNDDEIVRLIDDINILLIEEDEVAFSN
ncbi:SCO family protein [Aurantibacter crassamenti]|uniref:SCO family protein n=1 Tax=Aurantibacter crassamenti TaxID=1837375 RepID=UPI001939814F|nr:SCO family protein [Aurantibacter crassamenti]MBM1105504.1 SCO family protein [Aurantibacter crassamenti]